MQQFDTCIESQEITAMVAFAKLSSLLLVLILMTIRTEARPMHGPADPSHCPPGMGPGGPGMEWGRRGMGPGGPGMDWGRRGMGPRWSGGPGMGPRGSGMGMIGPETGPRGRGLGIGDPNSGDESKLGASG